MSAYKPTAVAIAAGGKAMRLGGGPPKSLWVADGRTYLELVLRSVSMPSIEEIVIYCDRIEYIKEIEDIASSFPSSIVKVDKFTGSTIALAQDCARARQHDFILFLYGHAPRPKSHIEQILRRPERLVVSSVASSSKCHAVRYGDRRYAEPPFLMRRELLVAPAESWSLLIEQNRHNSAEVPLIGPGEFNVPGEPDRYKTYIANAAPELWPPVAQENVATEI